MQVVGYLIREGVRRSVAVREAGRADIAVVIEVDGQPDQYVRLPLDVLYSRKPSFPRDGRYIANTEYPTVVLGTDPPEIYVGPIRSAARLRFYTPVRQVQIT